MSEQTTSEKATQPQIETITKIATRLYKGSASTVIEFASNYPLLNAIGRGDFESASAELKKVMDKNAEERAAYKAKASQPSS